MKLFIPLFLALFISGCTLTNINQPNNTKKEKKSALEILKDDNKQVFSSKYGMKPEHVYTNLNNTIIDIADQLFHTRSNKKNPTRVILTSFVDLNKLETTSIFGRLVSESMFNELHIRKFLVTDFRGRDAVTVSEDGEFHITRDVDELKDNVEAVEYILVGTYVKFENDSLLINARILDSISGNVFSSARVVYRPKDCSLFGICEKKEVKKEVLTSDIIKALRSKQINKKEEEPEDKTPIMIIEDK